MKPLWTPQQIELLRQGFRKYGTRWDKIQQWYLPDKEANQIKNKWYKIVKTDSPLSSDIQIIVDVLRDIAERPQTFGNEKRLDGAPK